MKAIRLDIYLDESLLMTGVANNEENSAISMGYIPGSALRGACIANYLKQHPDTDLGHDATARSLFFDDNLFFLNGYPASPFDKTHRAIPRSYAWHMEKPQSGEASDNREVRDYVWIIDDAIEPFERSKREERPFYWQSTDDICAMNKPTIWSNVHNASLNPMLKKEETSNVFRYEAMARDQRFVTYVIGQDETLVEAIADYLPPGQWFLGGSQTAGYGAVTVETTTISNWRGESEPDYDIEDYTIITLLSDVLLQSAAGHPITDFHTALELALGRDIPSPLRYFARTNLVGGFNRKWGLPLPQRWAVSMGSTFVYDVDDLDSSELEELVDRGIGQRRGEGFGRIGINLNAQPAFSTSSPTLTQSDPTQLSSSSLELAQTMAKRRLLQDAQTEVLRYVTNIEFRDDNDNLISLPHNTQLSQLRLVLRQALRANDLGLIGTHLDDLKKAASDQFTERRLPLAGNISWDRWLRQRARQNDGLTVIKVDVEDIRYQIAGAAPVVDDTLKTQVTCQLIEAVIRKAMREDR
ncbi:MAG: hypothetical protein KDE48_20840 [Anaerolineales bacterium]|nr:hypothetical protein [Anaerolineales bacterium]